MQIYDSFIEAGQDMPQRDRERFYTAVIEYLAYGFEPDVSGCAKAVLTAIMPSLEKSRVAYVKGKKGGRPQTQTKEEQESRTAKNEKAECGKTEKQNSENDESRTPKTTKPKDKDKDRRKDTTPNGVVEKNHRAFSPPSAAEIEGYAKSKGIRIDAERFRDYYAAQGWRLSNGNAMKDWKAAVNNWARRDQGEKGGAAYEGEWEYDGLV